MDGSKKRGRKRERELERKRERTINDRVSQGGERGSHDEREISPGSKQKEI